MPFANVPSELKEKMDRCVAKVTGTVDNPYAVCYTSVVEGHSVKETAEIFGLLAEQTEKLGDAINMSMLDRLAFEPFVVSALDQPFKILPLGKWFRGSRVLDITKERLNQLVANFNNGLPRFGVGINVEHGAEETQKGNIGRVKKISLHPDGVYAEEVELTDVGKQLLSEKRYRGVSPEIVWSLYSDKTYQDPKTGDYHDNVLSGLAVTTSPFFGEDVAIFSMSLKEKIKEVFRMSYDEIKKMRAKGANLDEIKKALEDDKMDGDMVAKHLKQLKDDEAADELRKKKDEARKETASIAALAEQMSAQAEQFAALEKQLVESEQQRTKLAEAFGAERQLRRTVEFVEAAEQFSAIPAKREELGKHLMWLYDSDPSDKKEHFTYFEGLLGRVNKVIGAGEVFSVVGDGRPGSGENEDQFLAAVEKIRVDKYADKTYAVGFAEAFKVAETSQPALARQYANSTYHKREKE